MLDGFDLDAVLHFGPPSTGLAPANTEVCIRSQYAALGGQNFTFYGCGPAITVK
jgi:hypothetical protein